VGGVVGARSCKRGGLGYRLVRKHVWTEMLGLLISMFLGLGYMSMCPIVYTLHFDLFDTQRG